MNPRLRRVVPVAILSTLLAFEGTGAAQPAKLPRVVVLGVDGMSADRTERLIEAGKLPALAAISNRGGYSRLATTNPAQSPVSWATLTTGRNPGQHGIYDFLRRTPQAEKLDPTTNVEIDIGIAKAEKRTTISETLRAALVGAAGVVGGAAGLGVVLALYAGERRKRRPRGLLVGTATGAAFVFSAVAYVVLAWVPARVLYPVNLRSTDPYWVTLDKKGVRCVVLEAPLSFPADEMSCGCCLSGLGVPDCQGTWGSYQIWTDDPTPPARSEMGGVSLYVEPGTTTFDVVLAGPVNPRADPKAVAAAEREADVERRKRLAAFDWHAAKKRASETKEELLRMARRATTRVAATIERGKSARLTTAEGVRVDLAPGAWSDLVAVEFRISPVAKVRARVRFLFESSAEDGAPFRLFVGPVQFDAAALPPNVRLASPPSFATELARTAGPFETLGWPELTSPVKDETLGDRAFLDHLEILKKSREKRLIERLKRDDWDCAFAMFAELDRVQHALMRHEDPESPTHDPKAAERFKGEIDRWYVEIDRIVGEVAAAAGPEAQVFVVSDHGFAPFRRGVNLNNFLMGHGLLVPAKDVASGTLFDLKTGVDWVKWSETKAYAMGLGNLYLNLAGRELHGVVKPAEAEGVLAEIERELLALTDPKTGVKVVKSVRRGKDLFRGGRAAEAPDLVVGFEWGYRVSWQNCLLRPDEDVIIDNKFAWSGDHCSVDPSLVPGVLFSTARLDPKTPPDVVDFAPSLLSIYGATAESVDGKSFLAR
jgi:predicted AlkP superfamily phosphohydrolase/phosphomutase